MEVSNGLVCESGAAYLYAGWKVRNGVVCAASLLNAVRAATFSRPQDPR